MKAKHQGEWLLIGGTPAVQKAITHPGSVKIR